MHSKLVTTIRQSKTRAWRSGVTLIRNTAILPASFGAVGDTIRAPTGSGANVNCKHSGWQLFSNLETKSLIHGGCYHFLSLVSWMVVERCISGDIRLQICSILNGLTLLLVLFSTPWNSSWNSPCNPYADVHQFQVTCTCMVWQYGCDAIVVGIGNISYPPCAVVFPCSVLILA